MKSTLNVPAVCWVAGFANNQFLEGGALCLLQSATRAPCADDVCHAVLRTLDWLFGLLAVEAGAHVTQHIGRGLPDRLPVTIF